MLPLGNKNSCVTISTETWVTQATQAEQYHSARLQAKTQSDVIMIIYMQLSLEYARKLFSYTKKHSKQKKKLKNLKWKE